MAQPSTSNRSTETLQARPANADALTPLQPSNLTLLSLSRHSMDATPTSVKLAGAEMSEMCCSCRRRCIMLCFVVGCTGGAGVSRKGQQSDMHRKNRMKSDGRRHTMLTDNPRGCWKPAVQNAALPHVHMSWNSAHSG